MPQDCQKISAPSCLLTLLLMPGAFDVAGAMHDGSTRLRSVEDWEKVELMFEEATAPEGRSLAEDRATGKKAGGQMPLIPSSKMDAVKMPAGISSFEGWGDTMRLLPNDAALKLSYK